MTDRPPPKEEDGPFLARWSRRKTESRDAAQVASEPPAETAPPAPPAEPEPPPELPDPESLTAESDFAPFLRDGVPEALRKAALRKLWATDPAWAKPDVLDIHNLDYSMPKVPGVVRTAWKVGKGYLDKAKPAEETPAEAAPTDTQTGAPPPPQTADDPPRVDPPEPAEDMPPNEETEPSGRI